MANWEALIMKALLLREHEKLEMTEMPEPQIAPDDLLILVCWSSRLSRSQAAVV
jgi:hypothetical protein